MTVRYPGRSEPAVDAVSAVLHAGERVAIAGPSGAGKTSLLAVLLRLLDPTDGRLLAGGVEAAAVDPRDWRAQFAWLPQRPRLAAGTLRDALAAGVPMADRQLLDAVELAGAGPVVAGLPDGLDTVLGERTPLSAGEIRRLALARALASDRPVLVLDEPTTHLNDASAEAVAAAIAGLPRDRLVLFATHDERLLDVADEVIDLASPTRELEAVA